MAERNYKWLWGWMTYFFRVVSLLAAIIICLVVYLYLKKEVTLPSLLYVIGFFTVFLVVGKVVTDSWMEMIVRVVNNGDEVKLQSLNKKGLVIQYSDVKEITTTLNDYYIVLDGDVKLRVNKIRYKPIVIKDGIDCAGNIKRAFKGVPVRQDEDPF